MYNCAAYSVDVYNEKYNAGANINDAVNFMTKQGIYRNCRGTLFRRVYTDKYADAIYYNGKHYAKVISWSSKGSPYLSGQNGVMLKLLNLLELMLMRVHMAHQLHTLQKINNQKS